MWNFPNEPINGILNTTGLGVGKTTVSSGATPDIPLRHLKLWQAVQAENAGRQQDRQATLAVTSFTPPNSLSTGSPATARKWCPSRCHNLLANALNFSNHKRCKKINNKLNITSYLISISCVDNSVSNLYLFFSDWYYRNSIKLYPNNENNRHSTSIHSTNSRVTAVFF